MKKVSALVFIIATVMLLSFKNEKKPTPYIFPKPVYFPPMPLSPTNSVTNEGVELGRFLFYDPILSDNGKISCSSCHKQVFAFSDSPNQFSKDNNDELMNRNTLPLFNLAWYTSLFWDGRASTLENQVFHPIKMKNEMNQSWKKIIMKLNKSRFYLLKFRKAFGNAPIDSNLVTKAIAQFERTLLSYNSKFDKTLLGIAKLSKDELEGYELMNDMTKGNCMHCHTTDANVLTTIVGFSNNGLDSVSDYLKYKDKGLGGVTMLKADCGKFKIPSLRNVALTAPYMHDGRFKTLEEVLNFYNTEVKNTINLDSKMDLVHQGGSKLTSYEKKKIISFLKALTDSTFITNKAFSNPF